MDRLVAARKASEPTVAYHPASKAGKNRRRVLIGLAALVLLLGLGGLGLWLAGLLWPHSTGRVFGVTIHEPQDVVKEKIRLTGGIDMGDPWKKPRLRSMLGHVLRPADLGLSDEQMKEVRILWTDIERTVALFHDDRLIAL